MEKTKEFFKVRLYGTNMKYIKDEEMQRYIYILTGRKTITANDIIALGGLGFHFQEVNDFIN